MTGFPEKKCHNRPSFEEKETKENPLFSPEQHILNLAASLMLQGLGRGNATAWVPLFLVSGTCYHLQVTGWTLGATGDAGYVLGCHKALQPTVRGRRSTETILDEQTPCLSTEAKEEKPASPGSSL